MTRNQLKQPEAELWKAADHLRTRFDLKSLDYPDCLALYFDAICPCP